MRKQKLPSYITRQFGGTSRSFKKIKRREIKELQRALDKFRLACAWVPYGPGRVGAIKANIDALKEEMSVRSWGR